MTETRRIGLPTCSLALVSGSLLLLWPLPWTTCLQASGQEEPPASASSEGDATLDELRRQVRKHPRSADAWKRLGDHCLAYHHDDEAEAAFRKSLRLDPKQAVVHWTLGTIHHGRGEDDAAQVEYETALEIAPDHTSSLYNLGVLYHLAGRLADAERLLKHGVGLDGSTLWPLGNVYADQGRWAEAAEAFERTRERPGLGLAGRALLDRDLGEAQLQLGRTDEAIASLERALEALHSLNEHPRFRASAEDMADVHYLLARVLAQSGDLERALGHLRGALRWNPVLRDQAARERELEAVRRLPAAADLDL